MDRNVFTCNYIKCLAVPHSYSNSEQTTVFLSKQYAVCCLFLRSTSFLLVAVNAKGLNIFTSLLVLYILLEIFFHFHDGLKKTDTSCVFYDVHMNWGSSFFTVSSDFLLESQITNIFLLPVLRVPGGFSVFF